MTGHGVRGEFHSGKHTETDEWMDAHPYITYGVAAFIVLGFIAVIALVVHFAFR